MTKGCRRGQDRRHAKHQRMQAYTIKTLWLGAVIGIYYNYSDSARI